MKMTSLGDLLELSDSGVWGDEDIENGISVLRSTNFQSNGALDFSKIALRAIEVRKRDTKILQPGDILLEKSGGGPAQPVGRVCLFKGDSESHSFGNFIARLRPKPEVMSEYLFYFLWRFHAIGMTSHYQKQTTGIRNLELKRYLGIEVPVVPLDEQRRIVDLLSRAEGIVRLRREAQRKAAELVPAIFLEMFGDPATNPKGWPVVALGEVLSAADYGSSTKASEDGQGVPLIRMSNVGYDGALNLTNLKYVQLGDAEVEKYLLRKGDILFNRTNSKELVGKTGLWSGDLHAVVASYFIRLRVDTANIESTYLWAFMNGRYMKKTLFDTARGAIGQANINSKELKAFRIMQPPLNMQKTFEKRVESVQSICAQQASSVAIAESTFWALLSNSLSN